MKVIVAPDKFKGALTAKEAASAIEAGVARACPNLPVSVFPMADGGEGTMEAMVEAKGGAYHHVDVQDPFMRSVHSSFAMLEDGQTAIVEMAAASGIALLKPKEQHCPQTTSYGTGELIKAALDAGATHILLALGGSATSDGGAGMAAALGARFTIDGAEKDAITGKDLEHLQAVDLRHLDPRLENTPVTILCDVANPLLGGEGAARTFAPQKGATDAEVVQLENGLAKLAELLTAKTKADPQSKGSGAAGGMGFGGLAFLGGRLQQGVEAILAANGFKDTITNGDLVLTGEGKLDATSASGKVVAGVASMFRDYEAAVVALCGVVDLDDQRLRDMGLTSALSIQTGPVSHEKALALTATNLENTAYNLMRFYEQILRSYATRHSE